ncbi:tyrosine-type recombinase/integrase [Paenibacillus andongensis]|uniref:tyrosine-type recombinase/integrase n=1 Tax=Paenibacillus andongensis TaxID=2975482 RepID=UPI0021BB6C53|nr:site-specific integrase [Paenibacillus andongensis]
MATTNKKIMRELSLASFFSDIEDILNNQDAELLRNFLSESTIKFSKTYPIFEQKYPHLFERIFQVCSVMFLNDGTLLSFPSILSYLSGSKSYTSSYRPYRAFMMRTMECVNPIIITTLGTAFNDFDIDSVKKIFISLGASKFIELVSHELRSSFNNYINACCKQIFDANQEVSWRKISRTAIVGYQLDIKYSNVLINLCNGVIEHWRSRQEESNNMTQMVVGSSMWNLPYKEIQQTRTVTLDFSDIPEYFRVEIQEYLVSWVEKGENPLQLVRRFHHLKPIVATIRVTTPEIVNFLDLSYVEVRGMFEHLQQQRKDNGSKKYALKSIQGHISEARLLFDWIRSKNNDTLKNPFRRFKFHNINSFVKNAEYIPEELIEHISIAIQDCSLQVQRIWLIMMNSGLRVSDVLNLDENCLFYNKDEGAWYLKGITKKTFNSRRKIGLEDYHSVPISEEIVKTINEQNLETQHLREIGKTKYIFIKLAKRKMLDLEIVVTRHTSANISNAINNALRRHQVKDNDGNLWVYGNHQCRKTLAVNLLTAGSTTSEVGEILGHSEEKTTRQYYQDVDALKIAQLDHQLFEMLFETIDIEIKQAYNPIEFESLKKEILTGARQTPEGHGSCLKHVSFGPCKKKSCVGCSLLLTGPQKLPMWKKLRDEQINYIGSMANTMIAQGIADFESFRDFQSENHLLSLYEDTISKIEKFILERNL